MTRHEPSPEIATAKAAARRRARARASAAPDANATGHLSPSDGLSVHAVPHALGDDSPDVRAPESGNAHEHPGVLAPGLHRLAAVLATMRADIVAGFLPLTTEMDLRPLFGMLRARGSSVVIPRIEAAALTFHPYDPARTRIGAFGITEPVGSAVVPLTMCAAVLVPALACDSAGNRLGRGGGFYDRALAELPAHVWKVGCVLDSNVWPIGEIPLEPHDVALDAVLTPQQLIVINPRRTIQ